jgi:hypothetical protein
MIEDDLLEDSEDIETRFDGLFGEFVDGIIPDISEASTITHG